MPGERSKADLNRKPVLIIYTHIWYILLLTAQGLLERMWILVKIGKADRSMLERLLLLWSEVAQRNEDRIACSVLISVISFGITLTYQCHKKPSKKRKAAYTCRNIEMFKTVMI